MQHADEPVARSQFLRCQLRSDANNTAKSMRFTRSLEVGNLLLDVPTYCTELGNEQWQYSLANASHEQAMALTRKITR